MNGGRLDGLDRDESSFLLENLSIKRKVRRHQAAGHCEEQRWAGRCPESPEQPRKHTGVRAIVSCSSCSGTLSDQVPGGLPHHPAPGKSRTPLLPLSAGCSTPQCTLCRISLSHPLWPASGVQLSGCLGKQFFSSGIKSDTGW